MAGNVYLSRIITKSEHANFNHFFCYLDRKVVDEKCRFLDDIYQMAELPPKMDFRVELRGFRGLSVWVRETDWQIHRRQKKKEAITFWVGFVVLTKLLVLVFWQGLAILDMIKIGQANQSFWWLIGFSADTFLLVLATRWKLKRVRVTVE